MALDIHSRGHSNCPHRLFLVDLYARGSAFSEVFHGGREGVRWSVTLLSRGKLSTTDIFFQSIVIMKLNLSSLVHRCPNLLRRSSRKTSVYRILRKRRRVASKCTPFRKPLYTKRMKSSSGERWSEVHHRRLTCKQSTDVWTGCLDIQVWLTAIAYMGIDVPLYSFSLFL